jgi:hypothetical protein
MAQIDLRRATIRFSDGGSNYIDVKIGEGNFEHNEKRQIDMSRIGVCSTRFERVKVPVEVSTTFIWDHIKGTGSEPPTVEDAAEEVPAKRPAWAPYRRSR